MTFDELKARLTLQAEKQSRWFAICEGHVLKQREKLLRCEQMRAVAKAKMDRALDELNRLTCNTAKPKE